MKTCKKRELPDWHRKYAEEDVESMPWYLESLAPDFEGALDLWSVSPGIALDLGTGPGTQAVALADRGFIVTATDLAETAVIKARSRFDSFGKPVCFVQDDILDTRLTDRFDLVLDRGVFHVFPPEDRPRYLEAIVRLVRPGGYFLLKCFNARETMEEGPYRFTPGELEEHFGGDFDFLEIRETEFQGMLDRYPMALFSAMRRRNPLRFSPQARAAFPGDLLSACRSPGEPSPKCVSLKKAPSREVGRRR